MKAMKHEMKRYEEKRAWNIMKMCTAYNNGMSHINYSYIALFYVSLDSLGAY